MPEKKVNKAVVCPMCGELSKAVVYTSVNATVDKEQRERVLDGGLFAWKCPSCGYSARLTYPILYNDMKNRFMIYLIPKIDRYQLCDKELEEKYSNLRNINKRVVADFNSFKEKIFIFESGLDDMGGYRPDGFQEARRSRGKERLSLDVRPREQYDGLYILHGRGDDSLRPDCAARNLRQVKGDRRAVRNQGQEAQGLHQDRRRVGGQHSVPLQARQKNRKTQ